VGGLVAVVIVLTYPGGLLGLANRLPGLQSGYSRVALWGDALTLVRDYPLTGGGLTSFAGHYSRYQLVIPYFLFGYAHNFLLDVLFEQGVFGALALAAIFGGSAWRLARAPGSELKWASVAAFVVVLLHGLVDDALYSATGTPWLFLLPGLGLLLAPQPTSQRRWTLAPLAALALAALVFALIPNLRAAALANFGAVEMARRELAGWPDHNWQDNQDAQQFTGAQMLFEQAITVDPHQRTAAYRLGLIALMRDNVAEAARYLEIASAGDGVPRGLAKNLGYAYTWLGEIEAGIDPLRAIPEAQYEMDLYAQWWPTVGQPERGRYAAQMARRLEALGLPYTGNPLEKIP
jgi:tetratricopeptide (TPR) repeat protein